MRARFGQCVRDQAGFRNDGRETIGGDGDATLRIHMRAAHFAIVQRCSTWPLLLATAAFWMLSTGSASPRREL
jgi:hypothetical protein